MFWRKIILRARQNYLLENFRSDTKTLSVELVNQLRDAWRTYVRGKVGKGLTVNDKPLDGEEEKIWPRLVGLNQNKVWRQECLKRDEKFEMHFSAAVYTFISCMIYSDQSNPF